ncbi:hypothetical protein EHS13_33700 [Paenibacillus psychroresistens]|uniref:Uncharacterized protein n=1 Tax=Paenibacillus psychroresistens TaxID=1778678 RepID=A0A6B8RW77_9BACL|nr:hypothetical protein [Paenibacillus psychroresistens]QGQ99466.1 hypothetical protein EHS13_33700 [Paenibacillus psychroresistens]
MRALRIVSLLSVVLFLAGCTQDVTVQEGKQVQEPTEQITQINEESLKLSEQINHLKEEKLAFLAADQFGREFYQAMVHGDVEKLKQVTDSNLEIFKDHIEMKVSEELVVIPFKAFQTAAHLSNNVIVKTNGYEFDPIKQVMGIYYMIIETQNSSAYFLNVELVKTNTLKWTVSNVELDV